MASETLGDRPQRTPSDTSDGEGHSDGLADAIRRVAKARCTDIAEVRSRFEENFLLKAPRSFSRHISAIQGLEISDSGVSGELAWIQLSSGRRFFSPPSKSNHRRAFEYVSDLISSKLTADTFLAALDVAARYQQTEEQRLPSSVLPPRNGRVMECGAYLGHKTIWFADELVPDGEVLAVEMMPENCRIFRRNIDENGLGDRISLLEAGVWSGPGELEIWGKGRQRNSLHPLEKIKEKTNRSVSVDSIDNHLDSWGRTSIDLLYITVNAAEIEALEGLDRWRDRVRAICIIARYSREARSCSEWCSELLVERGFELVANGESKKVCAINPGFATAGE